MAKSCSVEVRLGDLIEAAKQTGPKRAPAGARGAIAKTTLLYAENEILMVDTPVLATGIEIFSGQWKEQVECNPFHFLDMLNRAAKAWKDIGGKTAVVVLEHQKNSLSVAWQDERTKRSLFIHSLRGGGA